MSENLFYFEKTFSEKKTIFPSTFSDFSDFFSNEIPLICIEENRKFGETHQNFIKNDVKLISGQ